MYKLVTILTGAWLMLLAVPTDSKAVPPDVRGAIARAIPYVVEQGRWWIEEKKCVSCHRVAFTTWALSQADLQGFDLDRAQLQQWRDWSRDQMLLPPKADAAPSGTTNLEGVSQFLLAEQAAGKSVLEDAARGEFVSFLLDKQQDDGRWDAGGQLPGQKRPKDETQLISTAWHALALGYANQPAAAEARKRALAALDQTADGTSTEWNAVRLLLAVQSGARPDAKRWLAKLRSTQRADGGWGWLIADESDALATGMALYALRAAAVPSQDPAIEGGVRFLVESQFPEGSWSVHGTKEKSKDQVAETASYWGTCWAMLGLLSTLEASP